MAAGPWVFPDTARTSLLNGDFDIDNDVWRMSLHTDASNIGAASVLFSGVTGEVAGGTGYTAGGAAIVLTLAGTTVVTVDIQTDPVWTAATGSIVARYAVIYELGGSGKVLCYCLLEDPAADVTVTDGNTLTVAANALGVFTLT